MATPYDIILVVVGQIQVKAIGPGLNLYSGRAFPAGTRTSIVFGDQKCQFFELLGKIRKYD